MTDLINLAMSASAMSSAEEASSQARKAKNAAEERLEGAARWVTLPSAKIEEIEVQKGGFLGWGREVKERVTGVEELITVKTTDISHAETKHDDYGNEYTVVYFEERCNFDYEWLSLNLKTDELTSLLNGDKK